MVGGWVGVVPLPGMDQEPAVGKCQLTLQASDLYVDLYRNPTLESPAVAVVIVLPSWSTDGC